MAQARKSPAHPLFGASRVPLYLQLAEVLRRHVGRGRWPAGATLPSIEALMAEFQVARVTVRQAVALLAREGLLSPQRGRGTFVTRAEEARHRLKVETTLADLVEMYRGDVPELLTIAESDTAPTLTERDGMAAPAYFQMRRVHSRHGERYCVITIHIDLRIFRLAPERFRHEVILPVLVAIPGLEIARARQTLEISRADPEVAGLLGIPVNEPIAEVRRVLCDPAGTVIYLAEVTYRGDYVHLDMDLRP
ncbi:GntR family transcriptional regulator [Stella humosa]|uniref:GntR family transcriptional regulator n=1 Tax=Stella humosa TaxID=94 RepID=A0A3N1KZ06_9PROT|nr:GntR family transcriptional regulator [Stella humosa]ROP84397.1 GntR family transcriptional regulator [Stella humosa]BBK33913.1 GntR family transcriptional regulator [Stella humosa]